MDSGARSTTRALKTVGELEDLRTRVLAERVRRACAHLEEAEFADDGIGAADLVDVDGDFEFVE